MSFAPGSPEQMMSLLVGSPPGGPPLPLMGGFDPNEIARMQQAQQMNAAYYAIVPTQEMLEMYAAQGMPFPGNMMGMNGGANGSNNGNGFQMSNNNNNSHHHRYGSRQQRGYNKSHQNNYNNNNNNG